MPSRRDILINGQQYFVMATGGANLPPELIAWEMACQPAWIASHGENNL